MSEFYWELIQHDGTRLEIPPTGVEVIKRRMDSGSPIHTAHSGSIPVNQIKVFRPTDKLFNSQPLLDAASHAFHEAQLNPDGSVVGAWVKKHVTNQKWERYYSASPGYRKLGDENGMVVVAFRLPIHEIDVSLVSYCTPAEEERMKH